MYRGRELNKLYIYCGIISIAIVILGGYHKTRFNIHFIRNGSLSIDMSSTMIIIEDDKRNEIIRHYNIADRRRGQKWIFKPAGRIISSRGRRPRLEIILPKGLKIHFRPSRRSAMIFPIDIKIREIDIQKF